MSDEIKYFYEFESFRLDVAERQLLNNNSPVPLTPKTFDVLALLVENSGRLIEKEKILDIIWANSFVEQQNITRTIHTLRRALGEGENGSKFIETVPKKGYRFVAEVEKVSETPAANPSNPNGHSSIAPEEPADSELAAAAPETDPETSPADDVISPRLKSKRKTRPAFFAIAFLSAAVLALFLYFNFRPDPVQNPNEVRSIAVLPFENKSSDADTDYLSDGLAESLIYRLSQFSNLEVSPTSSVFRYKGKESDPRSIAGELGVDTVLTGRIVQRGDNLTISVNLVDARNGKSLWGEQYEREMSELLTTQGEIAAEITDKLHLKLAGEGERNLTKRYTDNNEAYQLYLRGRYEWNKFSFDGLNKSIPLFERAIQIDPTFALAYSGLADSHINLGIDYVSAHDTMPRARVAAIQAIALDDSLAEAHTSLGSYKMFYEWDMAGAEESYRKAIGLDPRYANARHFYSHCLQFSGREAEALREMRRAVELEPLSLVNNSELGWAYYLANQNDAAIAQLRKTIEIEPSYSMSYFLLGLVYADQGNHAEAVAVLREGQKLSPDWLELQAALAYTYASAGDRAAAKELLTRLLKPAAGTYVNPVLIASVYAALDDHDQAFVWLERGYREKSSWMTWIAIEPQLKGLRLDPRFQELVRRIHK